MVVLRKDRPRVLVAHHEPLIAETLRLILNRSGFETACVYSSRQAIEEARLSPPQVFLSEAAMPGISGIEAATAICALHPRCRVLLFAAEPGASAQRAPVQTPADGFEILRKPVPPVELLKRLRSLLRRLPATA